MQRTFSYLLNRLAYRIVSITKNQSKIGKGSFTNRRFVKRLRRHCLWFLTNYLCVLVKRICQFRKQSKRFTVSLKDRVYRNSFWRWLCKQIGGIQGFKVEDCSSTLPVLGVMRDCITWSCTTLLFVSSCRADLANQYLKPLGHTSLQVLQRVAIVTTCRTSRHWHRYGNLIG